MIVASTHNNALLYDSVLVRIHGGTARIPTDEECLVSIKSLLDAASTTMIITRNDTHRIIEAGGVGVSQPSIESPASAYTQRLWRLDPGIRTGKPAILLRANDFYSGRSFREFFNQCLRPFKLAPFISITTRINTDTNLCLRVARLEGQHDFTGTDLGLAQAIARHLGAALDRQNNPPLQSHALQQFLRGATEVMQHVRFGVIIMDDRHDILWCNDRGRAHLESVPISSLLTRLKGHAARAPRHDATNRIVSSSANSPASFTVNTDNDGKSIHVLGQRLSIPGTDGTHTTNLTVLYTSSDAVIDIDPAMIRHRFGLTAAESQVAVLLAQGINIDWIAQRLCKSRNTIRAQCRSIHEKMDVSSQAQLSAKILSSLGGMMDFRTPARR